MLHPQEQAARPHHQHLLPCVKPSTLEHCCLLGSDHSFVHIHLCECDQQVREGSPPLFSPGEATRGVLCPVLGSPVKEGQESPMDGYEDDQGTGVSLSSLRRG